MSVPATTMLASAADGHHLQVIGWRASAANCNAAVACGVGLMMPWLTNRQSVPHRRKRG